MKTTKATQRRKGTECGNCMDGKLVMAGETCGVCGHSEPAKHKPKRKKGEKPRCQYISGVMGAQLSHLSQCQERATKEVSIYGIHLANCCFDHAFVMGLRRCQIQSIKP